MKKLISIVTPCFNEELGVSDCISAIRSIFEQHLQSYDYEHIFCDNCSTDNTVKILKEHAAKDSRIKIIVNSRNFGVLKNTYNGVMNASGDAVILFMPVDLQDPPEIIPEFVKHWEQGYEIVYGTRTHREEPFFIRSIRKAYYRVLSRLTYVDYPPDAGDYQLVDRCVIQAMKQIDDAQPFMRLMTFDCGFRSIGIPYTWRSRKYGISKNGLMNMYEQGMNGIISFSGAPVKITMLLGVAISLGSILYAIGVALSVLLGFAHPQEGIPTVIVALFFFGGVQLFFLGVIGEYVLAIFNQVRRKPLVFERERVNFKDGETN